MIYLRSFSLPTADQEWQSVEGFDCPGYPYTFFSLRELYTVFFSPITMICGGNGSGKSTLLNMIAARLGIKHESAHYENGVFHAFVQNLTSVSFAEDDDGITRTLPRGSRLITGDDIVSVMLNDRERNIQLVNARKKAADLHTEALRQGNPFHSMDDYDSLCEYLTLRSESHAQYATRKVGDFQQARSNGETALDALRNAIQPGKLYLLDEPENSLSPRFQAILAKTISESAKYLDCQFIIATHSPFLMAMPSATLYDLDAQPIVTKPWYEFQSMRDWYALFHTHHAQFEEQDNR